MRFSLFLLLIVILGCKKDSFQTVAIIGHAGNGLNIPTSFYAPNSLQSIEMALGTPGVDGVEIDIQLSADQELWLYHDDQLNQATNGNGCISESTRDQLQKIKYKTANKEKLTSLYDLNYHLYAGKKIYLDLRHYNGCSQQLLNPAPFIDILTPLTNQYPDVDFIIVTNHKDWLNVFSQSNFTIYCDIETMAEFDQLKNGNYMYDGVIIRNSACTKDDVSRIKVENKKVILFDLRAPKSIRNAFGKTPDEVITDDVKAALIEKN